METDIGIEKKLQYEMGMRFPPEEGGEHELFNPKFARELYQI